LTLRRSPTAAQPISTRSRPCVNRSVDDDLQRLVDDAGAGHRRQLRRPVVSTFANGDSLNLNQTGCRIGNLPALNAAAPVNTAAATNITRIRMITYYSMRRPDPAHPRLVRRINNGHPTTFNNTLGTAVAIDIENLPASVTTSATVRTTLAT
jgi:hypothetical protein